MGLARRQRNPWQRVLKWFNGYDEKSPNVSNGIMSLFNVNDSNYIWTASTARAAYRRRSDGYDSGTMDYDMKFDESAWPEKLEIDYASGATGDMKKLRVGCVCDRGSNSKRLEHAWNLGTPDWDATLLPVRYGKGFLGRYESWNGSGSSWTKAASDDGQGVFEMLAGLQWNGLGDHSSNSVKGTSFMQTSNQDGKGLGSLSELEKLKIY